MTKAPNNFSPGVRLRLIYRLNRMVAGLEKNSGQSKKKTILMVLNENIMTERNKPLIEWYLGYKVEDENLVRLVFRL